MSGFAKYCQVDTSSLIALWGFAAIPATTRRSSLGSDSRTKADGGTCTGEILRPVRTEGAAGPHLSTRHDSPTRGEKGNAR